MRRMILAMSLAAFAATSAEAITWRWEVPGSAIYILATNDDGLSHTCTVSISYTYVDFSTQNDKTEQDSKQVLVGPHVKDQKVYWLSGSYQNLRLNGSPDIKCQ